MRIKDKMGLVGDLIGPLFFGKKKPVFVGWEVTRRCNLHCQYCDAGSRGSKEMGTAAALGIIKDLHRAGTRAIRFTGGEPLLRADIPILNEHARSFGILTSLSTNGLLFCDRIKEIRRIDSVSFSLDGPEEIHDSLRGQGTHKRVLAAMEEAKKRDIPVSVSATLSSLNLDSVSYLLNDMAAKMKVKVFFQPATEKVLFGDRDNPVRSDMSRYKETILFLIGSKKRNQFIGNSEAGLRHLYHWPRKRVIRCVAGRFICRLDAEGYVTPCPRFPEAESNLNMIEKGAKACFDRLASPGCRDCWCSLFVELNKISEFNVNSILNAIKS